MKDDYIRLTIENRKERREIRKTNQDLYDDMIIKYNVDVENMLE